MEYHEAEKLADHIENYWADLGFNVEAHIMTEFDAISSKAGSPEEFTVRTTPPLIGGFPRGATRHTGRAVLAGIRRREQTKTNDWRRFDDDPTQL